MSGIATGGNGGGGAIRSGDGGSALLENAVDGDTTGVLDLTQRAVGGAAGNMSTPGGALGAAGDATSLLSRSSASASRIQMAVEAVGGRGGNASTGTAGRGATYTRGERRVSEASGLGLGGSVRVLLARKLTITRCAISENRTA